MLFHGRSIRQANITVKFRVPLYAPILLLWPNPYRTGIIHRQAGVFAEATASAEFLMDYWPAFYHLYRPYDGTGDDAGLAVDE